MIRIVIGTLAGIVTGVLLVMAGEAAGHIIWPPPAGIDLRSTEAVARMVAAMPFGPLASLVLTWTVAATVGALVAALVARRAWAGWIVTAVLVAGVILNLVLIPHPLWVAVAGVAMPLLGGWIASRRARKQA